VFADSPSALIASQLKISAGISVFVEMANSALESKTSEMSWVKQAQNPEQILQRVRSVVDDLRVTEELASRICRTCAIVTSSSKKDISDDNSKDVSGFSCFTKCQH
jgi:hypothetical protein